jgi:hypothetical protein
MQQAIVALFGSYHDAHEALRALQALGLSRDHGHLYQSGKRAAAPSIPVDTPELDWRVHESAEYAAHGERPGAGANRYRPEAGDLGLTPTLLGPRASTQQRVRCSLSRIQVACEPPPLAGCCTTMARSQ